MSRLDRAVGRVLAADLCSGCGACTLLDAGLTMREVDGFARPVRDRVTLSGAEDRSAARTFGRVCPGRTVRAPSEVRRHPLVGPVAAAWCAWATDPEIRRAGSSGGALTALASWLVESGEAVEVLGAAASGDDPRRTVPVTITSRDEALAAAGSRYAPVAGLDRATPPGPRSAVVVKPCEASALRALVAEGPRVPSPGSPAPLVLTFFCAGTPSQAATTTLLGRLGIGEGDRLTALRYRGDGWPGRFVARTEGGREVSTTYDDSWGRDLGPTMQWRCKVCADGVGEAGDVAAADYWEVDDAGFPSFEDRPGMSALLARTARGVDVVRRAVAAGVLEVEPLDPDDLMRVQPSQRRRRTTLAGRLVGSLLGGRRVPRYRGFGLLRLATTDLRDALRTARGTRRRVTRPRRLP